MPGGCWICNPICGKCQPTPYRSVTCSDCGTLNLFPRALVVSGADLLCKKCHKDLSAEGRPKVLRCNYSGKLCAYPCGKSVTPRHDYGDQPCERNTPPSDEWIAAHPQVLEKLLEHNK